MEPQSFRAQLQIAEAFGGYSLGQNQAPTPLGIECQPSMLALGLAGSRMSTTDRSVCIYPPLSFCFMWSPRQDMRTLAINLGLIWFSQSPPTPCTVGSLPFPFYFYMHINQQRWVVVLKEAANASAPHPYPATLSPKWWFFQKAASSCLATRV